MVLAIIMGLNVFMAVLITVIFNKIHTLHSEIKDLKYSLKKEKEYTLKVKGQDLISVINRNVTGTDRLQGDV